VDGPGSSVFGHLEDLEVDIMTSIFPLRDEVRLHPDREPWGRVHPSSRCARLDAASRPAANRTHSFCGRPHAHASGMLGGGGIPRRP